MKTKFISSFAIMAMMLTGCITATSGNVNNGKDSDATIKKEIKTSAFNEIEVSQGIKVIVTQGKYLGKISVATTPSAEKYLCVKVDKGTLKAYYANKSMTGENIKGPSIINVTIPELEEADLSSGSYLQLKGHFTSNSKMEFDLSSGSSLNIENLSCRDLSIDASSGSSATIQYFKGNLDAESSSGSSITVKEAVGGALSAEASSGSGISLNSNKSDKIRAHASSGASITLSGSTGWLNKEASSGGSVNAGNLNVK